MTESPNSEESHSKSRIKDSELQNRTNRKRRSKSGSLRTDRCPQVARTALACFLAHFLSATKERPVQRRPLLSQFRCILKE